MIEVKVNLDFACCTCQQPVSVTVRCAGKGLAAEDVVAAVSVPCPNCGSVNQLCFEPDGTLRSVAPYTAPRQLPEPSLN